MIGEVIFIVLTEGCGFFLYRLKMGTPVENLAGESLVISVSR